MAFLGCSQLPSIIHLVCLAGRAFASPVLARTRLRLARGRGSLCLFLSGRGEPIVPRDGVFPCRIHQKGR